MSSDLEQLRQKLQSLAAEIDIKQAEIQQHAAYQQSHKQQLQAFHATKAKLQQDIQVLEQKLLELSAQQTKAQKGEP
ncbi:MAG: hypothetical protein CVV27_09905 [Candidatus Melainabacteria bacterium HGW-Melainabacteria-1]|nr:MAG: hypothetical protein CVV27_09905 [Candidatus Melainabacteria bacterium HGW-Melainabacteria-1]